jgi:hypothetical protein
MSDLFNQLWPQAKCVEDDAQGNGDSSMDARLQEAEEQMGGGSGSEFKSAMDFRTYSHRRPLFQTDNDKIEGFKFSLATALGGNFLITHKWLLYPPQNQAANPMMGMGAPPKSSHYELDLYYLHGAPEDPMVDQSKIDPTSITHFRGSVKAEGAVEAMILKSLTKSIDFRFEGFFKNHLMTHWNMALTHTSTTCLRRPPQREHFVFRKYELRVLFQPPGRPTFARRF